ncbi:hypothetical protein ACHAWO_011732 [Cyclotella atomus]|uniref:Uncharacterized protein n=1 Tax=Cyclotella atomus TaxID=382360 RepID=A0ABD3MP59_9STRA
MGDDEFDDDGIDWAAVELPPPNNNAPNHNNAASHNQPQTGQHHAVYNTANSNVVYSASTQPPIDSSANHTLQQQIADLQNLLASKDSRINELQATNDKAAAAAHNSEQEARNKIHLIEEELRRAKREADQYKGQWVRVKKRVAELEQQGGDDGMRAITPSNADHFHNHFKEDGKSDVKMDAIEGVKRKSGENEFDLGQKNDEKKSTTVQHLLHVTPPVARHESVRERIAKHLMLLDEMGCYSLNDVEVGQTADAQAESDASSNKLEPSDQSNSVSCKHSQDQLEQETKSFVKSILCHMVTDPSASDMSRIQHSMPVSGLVRILLERFNTLFYDCSCQKKSTDMDVDHIDDRVKDGALTLTITFNGKRVNHAAKSWRAVLYLLDVIHDTLNLSAKARDNLRWWFYQARQTDDSEDVEMSHHDATADSKAHTRIEGLPLNTSLTSNSDRIEAPWNDNCRSSSNEDNGWNATTMHLACNKFYEILVGLMNGVPSISKDNKILQHAQIKSIEIVSCLMSDAAPYDHDELNSRNKTPYLWKFWFDSLFPLYSTTEAQSDSFGMVDFFSIWEKDCCSYRKNLLGSGRRSYTQLITVKTEAVPTKHTKQSSRGDKAKSATVSAQTKDFERLAMNVKCKSLQMLCHFISSSSSLHQNIFQVRNQAKSAVEGVSLAKRILFAVLDELDEFAIPFLSSRITDKDQHDLDHCLDTCVAAMMFLLVLSRSDAGVHLLRVQTKLDFDIGGIYRWSSSAIGCVTAMMDGILLCIEDGKESSAHANLFALLNAIVQQCILFYKNVLSFVHNQSNDRPKAKATSFKAIIADHQGTTFVSCCHRIVEQKVLSDELKYEARVLLEEFVLDG